MELSEKERQGKTSICLANRRSYQLQGNSINMVNEDCITNLVIFYYSISVPRKLRNTLTPSKYTDATWKVSVFVVFLVCIQSECGKIRTRKIPNTDTLYVVWIHKNTIAAFVGFPLVILGFQRLIFICGFLWICIHEFYVKLWSYQDANISNCVRWGDLVLGFELSCLWSLLVWFLISAIFFFAFSFARYLGGLCIVIFD